MKINWKRDCPDCKRYLEKHPTLEVPRVLEQTKDILGKGSFRHTTKAGRMLHKCVVLDLIGVPREEDLALINNALKEVAR
jgi:hypothetical protein